MTVRQVFLFPSFSRLPCMCLSLTLSLTHSRSALPLMEQGIRYSNHANPLQIVDAFFKRMNRGMREGGEREEEGADGMSDEVEETHGGTWAGEEGG